MGNLRSQVSKLTCVTIAEMAVVMQGDFEPLAEMFAVALLKLPKIAKDVRARCHVLLSSASVMCVPRHANQRCHGTIKLKRPQVIRSSGDLCMKTIVWNSPSGFHRMLLKYASRRHCAWRPCRGT